MEIKGHIQHAVKTNDEWLALNPVLHKGERVEVQFHPMCTNYAHKIGDGIHKYADLDFALSQGKNAMALVYNGIALGGFSQAGMIGYKIVEMSSDKQNPITNDTKNNVITDSGFYIIQVLSDTYVMPKDELIGQQYFIHIKENNGPDDDFVGTITEVEDLGNKQFKLYAQQYFHPKGWAALTDIQKQTYYASSFIYFPNVVGLGEIYGVQSTALGYAVKSIGDYSHTHGRYCVASGNSATACGNRCIANGYGALASGIESIAFGEASFVHGNKSVASGKNSIVMGSASTAAGDFGMSFGNKSHAPGKWAVAIGYQAEATKTNSIAIGYNAKSLHTYAQIIGFNLESGCSYQTVVGKYNKIHDSAAFVVGNGSSANGRSNAFEVQKDGRATVAANPKNPLDVVTKQYADAINTKVEQLAAQFAELILINEGGIE